MKITVLALVLLSLVGLSASLALADTNFVAAVVIPGPNNTIVPVPLDLVSIYLSNGTLIPGYQCLTESNGICNVTLSPGINPNKLYGISANNKTINGTRYTFGFWYFFTDKYGNGKGTVCTPNPPFNCDVFPPVYNNTSESGPSNYSSNATYFNVTLRDEYTGVNSSAVTIVIGNSTNVLVNNATMTYLNCYQKVLGDECNYSYSTNLPAGSWYWESYAPDNSNNNASTGQMNFTISQATPICSLSFNPVSPITYGTSVTASCGCTSPEASAKLYRDGNDVTLAENNTAVVLGAGTHNYICNVTSSQNYTSASNSSSYIVNQVSRSCTLATDKSWTRTYDGTQSTTSCSVSVGSTDGLMTFTKAGSSVASPDSQTNAGSFAYACQWTGGTNYSDCIQQTNTLLINRATPSCTLTSTADWSYTYGSPTTLSCSCIGDGTTHLYFNNVLHDDYNNQNIIFGANSGVQVVCNTTQGNNYNSASASNNLTIGKASSSLSCSGSSNTYPTSISFSGSGCPTQGASDVSCTLTNPTPTGCPSCSGGSCNILCTAGTYSSTYTTTGGQNWTSSTSSQCSATESKGTLQGFSSSPAVTYPASLTATGTETNSGDADMVYQEWCDNVLMGQSTGGSPSGSFQFGVGSHSCELNTTAGTFANWSSSASIGASTGTVNIGSRTCTLSTNQGWGRTYDGSASSTTCSVSAGSSDGSMTFTMNGGSVSTPNSQTSAGTYNYACQWTGGTNYSDCTQQTNTLTINKASRTCNLATNEGWTRNYDGSTSSTSCSVSAGSGDGSMTFTKNSNSITTPDSQIDAGSFNYVCGWSEGTNYLSCSQSDTLMINKINPVFSTSLTPSITYGTASDYSGSESNSGDTDCTYTLLRNGTSIGSGSSVSDSTVLGAGTYNYTYYTSGCTNYNFGKDEKILTVNKATPIGSLASDKGWNVYNGTTVTIGYTESNTGDNDVTYKVFRNGTDKGSGETWTPAIGNYNYKLSTTGGTNYSATDNIDTETLVVSPKIPASCSLTSSSGWSYAYGTSTTLQCSCTGDGTTHLYVDNVLRDSWNNTAITFAAKPSGYSVMCNITEGPTYQQSSNTDSLIVNKAPRDCTLSTDKGWTRTYDGTQSTTSCSVSVGSSDGTMTFTKNTNPISSPDLQTNAGSFAYVCQWTGGANYSDCSEKTDTLTISKADRTCTLSTNKGWSRTYDGTASSTSCTVSVGSSDGTMIFTKNTNPLSTPDSQTNAGTFNYACQWTGGTNYNDCPQQDYTLAIDKAIPTGSLSTSAWSVTYPTSTTVSCSLSSGDTGTSLTLKRDSVTVSTGTLPSETITLGYKSGGYSYTCTYPGTQNYYAATLYTHTLSVSKATPSLNLAITPSWTVIYPTQTTATCSMITGDSSPTLSLFRNSVSVSNPDTATLPLGSYLYVCSIPATQNYTSTQVQNTLNVVMNAPAVVTILSPNSSVSYYKSNVLLNFTLSKPVQWIEYSLDNSPNITIPGPINLSSQLGSTYPLSNGHHNVTVYAGDPSGSVGYSSVNFSYCLGDVTSLTPWVPDGKVDIRDVNLVAKLYGCNAGSACYDPRADLNGDGKIDIRDVNLIAKQYGTYC